MSSAILYLAIVAIWAGVLVPRWLRRDVQRERTGRGRRFSRRQNDAEAVSGGDVVVDGDAPSALGEDVSSAGGEAPRPERTGAPPQPPGRTGQASRAERERSGRRRAERRGRVRMARRRMMTGLVLLAGVAAGITVAGLAPWWVTIPPAGMLIGYTALLRTAARMDAEQAHERARMRTERAAVHRGEPPVSAGVVHALDDANAEIIDIAHREDEKLYDQYTDAELRAVGD